MSDRALTILTAVSAVGTGVVGGVFFAFSTFVMKAFGRLPPANGIAAMQEVNEAAPTAWLMTALFGTGVTCVALAVSAAFRLDEPDAPYQLVAGALYLTVIVLTAVYHVPRNDALATIDPNGAGAADHWARYLAGWTAWNHARTMASTAAAASLVVAVLKR